MGMVAANYTIADFWLRRLTTSDRGSTSALPGWGYVDNGLVTFVEAPLRLSPKFGEVDPERAGVVLVSAPGAVGKTTLAKQIAFETGALLVDLAKADPVGANTLVGGLAEAGVYQQFLQGSVALIVDGLDEARMRVTQEGMAAFMRDVVKLGSENRRPIVLLGRTGSIEDAWLWLTDEGVNPPVLEIGYYEEEEAGEFARRQVQHIRDEAVPREPDRRAVDLILKQIRNQTLMDGGSFAGYSPVLIAVAKKVAPPPGAGSMNTQELISRIERGTEALTLDGITRSILLREQEKVSGLNLEDEGIRPLLYTPDEQIRRLVCRLYGCTLSFNLPSMSSADQERYSNALESWFPEHPFLDGEGRGASSAVFSGLLAAHALREKDAAVTVLSAELARGTAANPFLAEFYISLLDQGQQPPHIQPEHLGAIYASIRSRLSIGDFASLTVDGETDDEDADSTGMAEIEIARGGQDGDKEPLRFRIDAGGTLLFGSHLEDADVTMPLGEISLGYGAEVSLVAPIFFEARSLSIDADRLIVEEAPGKDNGAAQMNAVQLIATEAHVERVGGRPVRRGRVTFEVTWPHSEAYPWTDFSILPPQQTDPRVEEGLRRLKKILRLFRSHSRNQLAKYKAAIDHRRRTKGVGRLIRDQLVAEGILTVKEPMYHLDPDRLADATGLNFHDVRATKVHPATVEFIGRALERES